MLAPLSCERDEKASANAEPATSAAPTARSSASTSATATATSTAAGMPAAKATIAGTSVSVIGVEDLRAALEKHGYVYEAGRQIAMGSRETVVVKAKRDGRVAAITIVRPTGKIEHDRFPLASPEAQRATFEKKGAAHYEAGVLVGVEVEGDPAQAKELLETLLDD